MGEGGVRLFKPCVKYAWVPNLEVALFQTLTETPKYTKPVII